MIRNMISPVQAWLISQGRCVGCGNKLERKTCREDVTEKIVSCTRCGRIYIYEVKRKKFIRAPLGTKV